MIDYTFDVVVPRVSRTRGNVLVKLGELTLPARGAAGAVSRGAERHGFTMAIPPKEVWSASFNPDTPLAGPGYDLIDFAVVQANGVKVLSIGSMRHLDKLMRAPGFKLT